MPLPKPSLDNRVFDQLVAESRAQIPRLAPRWTDHNASDPGITLLELAAWLAEQNLYRLDRPSDEALRGFARLVLQQEPRPAAVARTVVAATHDNAAGVALPPRIRLGSPTATLFETTQPLFASQAQLLWVGGGSPATASPVDLTPLNAARRAFWPLGARPRPGSALILGFDRALDAPGRTLSLHLWTERWTEDIATRQALQDEAMAQAARLQRDGPPCAVPQTLDGLDWRHHYRAQVVWEYHAGGVWLPLDELVDETRALSLAGFVRFAAPTGHQALGGVWPIRCRLRRGRFECPPRLLHIAFNAVEAEHALSRAEAALGRSRGHAASRFAIGAAPIVAGSVQLRLDDGAGDVQTGWHAVASWDRCGPHDACLRLDAERGVLHAGDGLRGAVPPAGYELRAACRIGGGPQGNLDAATLTTVPADALNDALTQPNPLSALPMPLRVTQPFAATGGQAAEGLPDFQARAFDAATRVDKAVTLADFERLALATPGVPVARVHAVAGLHPLLPCYPAPGVVTLIVVPRCPRPAPMPSRALLDAVARHLAPRRLVTSELHVVAPHYRRVSVQATLHLDEQADAQAVRRQALARIDAWLDPLDGGPGGGGWPIGRAVYRNEVMALLAALDGVERVTGLGFDAPCADGGCCDNVVLCAHELVRPGRHRLHLTADTPRELRRSDAHVCEPQRSGH